MHYNFELFSPTTEGGTNEKNTKHFTVSNSIANKYLHV